ncbi:MAG: hypothetical protein ACI857_003346 [Arenicella sp.]
MLTVTIILSILSILLILGPFIGLILDIRKSRAYELFAISAGFFILFFFILKGLMSNIVYATLFAFTSVPLLFVYILIANSKKKSADDIESEDIIDDFKL